MPGRGWIEGLDPVGDLPGAGGSRIRQIGFGQGKYGAWGFNHVMGKWQGGVVLSVWLWVVLGVCNLCNVVVMQVVSMSCDGTLPSCRLSACRAMVLYIALQCCAHAGCQRVLRSDARYNAPQCWGAAQSTSVPCNMLGCTLQCAAMLGEGFTPHCNIATRPNVHRMHS